MLLINDSRDSTSYERHRREVESSGRRPFRASESLRIRQLATGGSGPSIWYATSAFAEHCRAFLSQTCEASCPHFRIPGEDHFPTEVFDNWAIVRKNRLVNVPHLRTPSLYLALAYPSSGIDHFKTAIHYNDDPYWPTSKGPWILHTARSALESELSFSENSSNRIMTVGQWLYNRGMPTGG